MPHPSYSAHDAIDAAKRSGIHVGIHDLLMLAGKAARTSSGAVYVDMIATPAEALAVARYLLGTDNVEFAGMVLGKFPAYRVSSGRGQEDGS